MRPLTATLLAVLAGILFAAWFFSSHEKVEVEEWVGYRGDARVNPWYAAELLVREDELVYEVDVEHGHKTGHYLDQRENRRRFAELAAGARVYDGFCYDGLFGLRAALAGALDCSPDWIGVAGQDTGTGWCVIE